MAKYNGQSRYIYHYKYKHRYSAEAMQSNGAWLYLGSFQCLPDALEAYGNWRKSL